MKKVFLWSLITLSIAPVAFGASGSANIEQEGKGLKMYIGGEAAEYLYHHIEMEPGKAGLKGDVKVGQNMRCYENQDEYVCQLGLVVLPDGNLNGAVTLHGN